MRIYNGPPVTKDVVAKISRENRIAVKRITIEVKEFMAQPEKEAKKIVDEQYAKFLRSITRPFHKIWLSLKS